MASNVGTDSANESDQNMPGVASVGGCPLSGRPSWKRTAVGQMVQFRMESVGGRYPTGPDDTRLPPSGPSSAASER